MPLMSRRLPVWAQDALLAAFVTYAQISGTQRSAPEALAALDTVGMYGHAILLSTSGVGRAGLPGPVRRDLHPQRLR
jgi:hypothetical protein